MTQAAGGVQARARVENRLDPASSAAGSTRADRMRARSPGLVVRANRRSPDADQRAVLVDERDDVRDRRERDEVEVLGSAPPDRAVPLRA